MKVFSDRWFLIVLAMSLFLAGCAKKKVQKEEDDKPVDPRVRGQQIGKYLPSVGRVDPGNDLRSIGQFYLQHQATSGRPPMSLDDLPEMQQEGRQLVQLIQSGEYVVLWGLDPANAGSNVLAYHKNVPMSGGMVLLGDGSVHNMQPQQFQATPKGPRGQ